MARVDDDVMHRGELAPFAADATAEIDVRVDLVRPDFAAMMARAHNITEDEEPLAPVVSLVRPRSADDGDKVDAELAAFTGALTSEIDARLLERVPPSAVNAPPALGHARVRGVVLGLLTAAAAVLIASFSFEFARRVGDGGRGVEANATQVPGDATLQDAPARTLTAPLPSPTRPAMPTPEIGDGEPAPSAAMTPPLVDSVEPPPADSPPAPRATRKPRQPAQAEAAPRQPTLEEEGQALWERGELAAAEQKFREVLLSSGDGRRAELAFGDLFTLARQLRGSDGQAEVWREYLGRFPRGRFAEDARAGLCQRANGDTRAACWRNYLEHHPDGAHRALAEAASAPGEARP